MEKCHTNPYKFIKNNGGLTLVELIVVIAIMAVMIGAGGFSLSLLTGAEAKRAANNLNVQLNDIKTETLTTAAEIVTIRYIAATDASKVHGVDKNGYYVVKELSTIMNTDSITTPYRSGGSDDAEYAYLGSSKVTIKVGDTFTVADNNCVQLEFNRRTGELKTVLSNTVGDNYNDFSDPAGGTDIMTNPTEIKLSSGLAEYVVTIKKNGSHEMKKSS